jgi:undecaprenyl-diphosphatase
MFELQYLLIGILQGITEFLPISSSGHLVLFAKFTFWDDQGLFTDIAVHFGTLCAVIFYMRKDLFFLIINIFKSESLSNKIILKIIVATLPAIFVGFFIYDLVNLYFRDVRVIALSSIIFGIILYFADKRKSSQKNWENITIVESLIIGLWQVMAFVPGASRAGVTITGARFLHFNRINAVKFSMLLSIPIILASLSLSLFDIFFSKEQITNINPSIFAACISFITALLSIHFMMNLIKITNFNLFIIYRIILGITLLGLYA